MTQHTLELNRAQVTVTPPGASRLLTVLGNTSSPSEITVAINKQSLYTAFYEMYRRHPWVRAGIDKRAQLSVSGGYTLRPEDVQEPLNKAEAKEFRAFARRSNFDQLRRNIYRDIDTFSEGFAYVQLTKGGRPYKAFRLVPKYVSPVTVNGELIAYKYGAVGDPNRITYPAAQVLHFKDDDPENDVQGLSKLYSLMETVAQDLFAMRYNLSFFENAAQTGIVFNMRNASKEEAERNRVWLEQNYSGAERAHRPIVLEGDIEIKSSVSKHHEMEFVEGRKVNRQEILAVLDVNETLLGITEGSNRAGAKENNVILYESLAARQIIVEEEINNKLILGLFGWDDILFEEADSSKRAQLENASLLLQFLQNGVYSRDEIRALLGKGNIAGGDLYTVQTAAGMIPVDQLDEAWKLLKQQADQPSTDQPSEDEDGNDAQKREDRKGEVDARDR